MPGGSGAVQLPGQVRSQVQLGNEENQMPAPPGCPLQRVKTSPTLHFGTHLSAKLCFDYVQRRGPSAAEPEPNKDGLVLTQSAQRDWRGSQRDGFSVASRIYAKRVHF